MPRINTIVIDPSLFSPEIDIDGSSASLNPYDSKVAAFVGNFHSDSEALDGNGLFPGLKVCLCGKLIGLGKFGVEFDGSVEAAGGIFGLAGFEVGAGEGEVAELVGRVGFGHFLEVIETGGGFGHG
jgi:hypothetical protein